MLEDTWAFLADEVSKLIKKHPLQDQSQKVDGETIYRVFSQAKHFRKLRPPKTRGSRDSDR